ncbi:hypothetical protein MNV49_000490 [Pseudohyphozyma bogoriensis]|nr:hypothetical protein MNV49_000490 [Pseudohyphozyma bogoriensis]
MDRPPWYKRELTGRRLVWNIFFYVGHVAIFAYGWHKQQSDPRLAALNGLKFSVWISRGAGLALGVDGLLLVLPVLRNLICVLRPKLAWLMPLDENIWFHRQSQSVFSHAFEEEFHGADVAWAVAYSLLFFTIVHTTAHYVNMFNVELTQVRKETAIMIMYSQPGAFTGHVMLVIMFLMYTTAHARIRKQCFEAFWYTHHLAFFFLLGLYTHAVGCFVRGALPDEPVQCLGYESWRWTIWGGILYFGERVWREIRARRSTKIVGVLMHPSGAMEIRFEKLSFKYKAGMWLFLNVPEVSTLQWHPFTISSAPDDPYVSVHIRQVGDFTKALGNRLGCTEGLAAETSLSASGKNEKGGYGSGDFVDVQEVLGARSRPLPTLRIDGPYGAPAEDVFKNEVCVLVGTGIGVTPFASILKNIWYMQQQGRLGVLRRVEFIVRSPILIPLFPHFLTPAESILKWCNRDTGSFEWFQTLLKRLEDAQTDPNFLRIHMYLTARISPDVMQNIAINDAGNEFDALTNLRSRTNFGRPEWDSIFSNLRHSIETGRYLPGRESSLSTTVGVYYCGPGGLAKTLKEKTKKASTETVKFTFVKEHF